MNCIRCGSAEFELQLPACAQCGLTGEYLHDIASSPYWQVSELPGAATLNQLDEDYFQ